MIEGLQKVSQPLYNALKELGIELERFFAFVKVDPSGEGRFLSFGELKVYKNGLIESLHGVFYRKTLESDSPICARYKQAVAVAGAGLFVWDTIEFESNGFFLRKNANQDIQVTRPGKYLVCAHVLSYNNGAGVRQDAHILKNGAGPPYEVHVLGYAGATGFLQLQMTAIINLAATDYIQVDVTGVDRHGAAAPFTILSIHKLN